ncbi:MAG: type II toxin-antitoxin system prevent-host-death family antitoxin [Gammaproteobacteria bacterium]|nr:type II toxin-antitoxin system prevent-host-death family antitoxin [Gammaproteobacteria bacterium]MDE0508353.1 type II toxin-antitoxin system prevent-host-death family antitoxin [Gammaproteobacteria bacterium]MXX05964.1 type II toxin-antitoxin system prevent-host-death family antitoxin [Gammaproteobacteria bacterium]MYA66261.1 type II toxin-antitoxin system prevent-host-death family antitoxin [Gammaproteobacteria bacterium]MYE29452.1 type II toxin-antitoxin system prevent-host-death family a
MIQAKISELKNGLSAYLRRVKSGESVLVLDRNTPVARLVPIESAPIRTGQAGSTSEADEKKLENEALLDKLERKGIIARRRGPSPMEIVRSWEPFGKDIRLVEAVLEEREEDYETGYR